MSAYLSCGKLLMIECLALPDSLVNLTDSADCVPDEHISKM
jgi:hypothetical protein